LTFSAPDKDSIHHEGTKDTKVSDIFNPNFVIFVVKCLYQP